MKRKLSGYVHFKTDAVGIYRFLNKCKNSGVSLKKVYTKNNSMRFSVKNREVLACLKAGKESDVVLEECGRSGIVNEFLKYRKRKLFFVSFAILVIVFAMRSLFISKITVVGNKYLTDSQITELLSECSVEEGDFKFFVNQREVQKEMLTKCELISWVWIEIKGTHLTVEVREKISVPEIFDAGYACNIVASRDGVITEAVASGGTLYAKEGTYVKKGDLLIGGVYDSNEYAPVRFVHASGNVFARTRYIIEDDFGNEQKKYIRSSKLQNAYGVKIGSIKIDTAIGRKNIVLPNPFDKKVKIFGKIYLPLSFTKTKYCEIIEKEYKLDEVSAQESAFDELSVRMKMMIPDEAVIADEKKEITQNSDGTFHAKLIYDCVENIGEEAPIEITYE